MNIYKISQTVNVGYDTYDSAVVVAENELEAAKIHPFGLGVLGFNKITCKYDKPWYESDTEDWSWASRLEDVKVELIGTTDLFTEPCIIIASFNAG